MRENTKTELTDHASMLSRSGRLIHKHCHRLRYCTARVVPPTSKFGRPISVPLENLRRDLFTHAAGQLVHLKHESLCVNPLRCLLCISQPIEQFVKLAGIYTILVNPLGEISNRTLNCALDASSNRYINKALSTCDVFLRFCADQSFAPMLLHRDRYRNGDCDYRTYGLNPSGDRGRLEFCPFNSIIEQHSNDCCENQGSIFVHHANHLTPRFLGAILA